MKKKASIMENYQTNILTAIDDTFIAQWKELWGRAENANVFNSYAWFLTCQQANNLKAYEVYACYKDSKLVAVLPTCVYTRFGIKVSGSLSSKFLVDTAFLVEKYDSELFNHFFSSIVAKRNIFIQKVDDRAAQLLHKTFPGMFFSLISVNPCIDLTGELFATVSHSTVSQIQKIRRRNPDQFSFKFYSGSENIEKHLPMMFHLEQNSSKKMRSMDIFSEPMTRDFFIAISKNSSELVRIGFLYYNNQPIAYQFGFLYNNIFVAYQTAYLHEYGKLRPGKTMIFSLLENLKAQQVAILDLGGGLSTYKQEFTPKYRLLYDVYYSTNALIMFWWKMINAVRRARQIVAPKKHTRDHEFLFKPLDNL